MTVMGICMVKDEADIIGYTLPRMAAQLDHVLVADNLSTDQTSEILAGVAMQMGNVTILRDDDPAYLQSDKMTALAWRAHLFGAEWVVPFDADEVWVCTTGTLRDCVLHQPGAIAEAALYDHVVSATDDSGELDPVARIVRRRALPVPLPKVACKILPGLVIEMGNHGARYPGPVHRTSGEIVVHHYPYRSPEQMARKARNGAAAYAAAGDRLPPSAGQHWRDYGRFLEQGGEEAIREIFERWFYVADPDGDETTIVDPCPVPMF